MAKKYPKQPIKARILNDYKTENLNKAVYLILRGSIYVSCDVEPDKNIGSITLDNVNARHMNEFWKDDLVVELWSFLRTRAWLKSKIKEKKQAIIDEND